MNIFPDSAHDVSEMPVLTITLLDSDGGPQTINVYGATDLRAYSAKSFGTGTAEATVHIRVGAGDWDVVSAPKG
jgi:hypothetical protein